MNVDTYNMGRLTALFLAAGTAIPEQFLDCKPKLFQKGVEATDPDLIANIEKQGWHIRKIELTISAMVGSPPPR